MNIEARINSVLNTRMTRRQIIENTLEVGKEVVYGVGIAGSGVGATRLFDSEWVWVEALQMQKEGEKIVDRGYTNYMTRSRVKPVRMRDIDPDSTRQTQELFRDANKILRESLKGWLFAAPAMVLLATETIKEKIKPKTNQ